MSHSYDRMLQMLLDQQGGWLSGEAASQTLGVTRAAVWKQIRMMQKDGWPVESVTGRGYRLDGVDAPYAAGAVSHLLRTRWLGRNLEFSDTVDSTNNRLKALAALDSPKGTVVIADRQTGGRGRIGRSWSSEPGLGIWMSILLRPQMPPTGVQALTLAASVAVVETINPVLEAANAPQAGIKWPNDVLAGDRKVCGILTEMGAEADSVSWVVIGIGINVLHRPESFPPELSDTAASLRMLAPETVLNRSRLAADLLNRLETLFEDYEEGRFPDILERWRRNSITLGRRVSLTGPDGGFTATARDVLPDGRLLVETDDGGLQAVLSGEISLRPMA